MANANHSEKNRLRSFGAVVLTSQATCPIAAGDVGLWFDGASYKFRNADGSDATPKGLDGTAADIAPLGPAKLAGAVGKAADAGHVHQLDVSATRFAVFAGVDSSGGASHVAIAALKVGDQVIGIINLTDAADSTSKFEATVTVAGQLQQPQASGDLSAKKFAAFFVAKS